MAEVAEMCLLVFCGPFESGERGRNSLKAGLPHPI